MSKTFTYTKITEVGEVHGSLEEYGEEFEYEVDDLELKNVIVDLIWQDSFSKFSEQSGIKNAIKNFIDENDLLDTFVDQYEDCLKEYFREEAFGREEI